MTIRSDIPTQPRRRASMPVFGLVCVVFLLFGILIFPVAIHHHAHLFADGSYFFARLVEAKSVDAAGHTPARVGHHLITQSPVLVAMWLGVTDISALSMIYGAVLFYLPWILHLAACLLFLRARRPRQALLLALLYAFLTGFSSWFIISESHLAAALFVCTLAVSECVALERRWGKIALLALGLASLSCYEFWAPFSLVILFSLFRKSEYRTDAARRARIPFVVLHTGICLLNMTAILFSPIANNRNAMFGSHVAEVWPFLILLCAVFTACAMGTSRLLFHIFRERRIPARMHAVLPAVIRLGLGGSPRALTGMGIAFTVAFILFLRLTDPVHAYAMRSLNLLMPLIFAVTLFAGQGARADSVRPPRARPGLIAGVACLLLVTGGGWTVHLGGYRQFQEELITASRSSTGYCSFKQGGIENSSYGWPWTYPSMSIVLQTMNGFSLESVLYDPAQSYQPFGPDDVWRTLRFASAIGLDVRPGALRRTPAPEPIPVGSPVQRSRE